MKILFLSFYFEPDLCAGSFRATAIARALAAADPALQVEILSTQPNRYGSYSVSAPPIETAGSIEVHRFALPTHRSGMRDQSRAFLAYARQVLLRIRGQRYDAVLATSSRLMTASLGALVARWKDVPLYLDIRDIFVDTLGDVLPPRLARWTKGPFSALEQWTMSGASKINLVSEGFRDYFMSRHPSVPLTFFTNGIDDEFIDVGPAPPKAAGDATEVLYAGNIGEGQGLHLIIPALAQRMPDTRFRIIGDGGRLRALQQEIAARNVTNVVLQAPVRRSDLVAASLRADVLFLHLNDYPAFQKVLPSKIFEYAALGKPVWAGVAGYSADFIQREIANAAIFPPCDVESAVRSFATLDLRPTPRPQFVARYARRNLARQFALDFLTSIQSDARPTEVAQAADH